MPNRNADLNRRSQAVNLTPWAGSGTPPWEDVLAAEAKCGEGAWRVVEIATLHTHPFDVHLSWTGGHGGNISALVTVSRGTRIGLYAKSLTVRAANLVNGINTVVCNIADSDSFVQTHNQYEVRGNIDHDIPAFTTEISVPPFARYMRLMAQNPADLTDVQIIVYDGQNVARSTTKGDAQPETGVPLGGAKTVVIQNSTSSTLFRVVFDLSL